MQWLKMVQGHYFIYLFIIALQHHTYIKDYKKITENYDI